MSVADDISQEWQDRHGRDIGLSEREEVILAHVQRAIDAATAPFTREDLLTLLADNLSLHAKVKRLTERVEGLERKVRRIDPEQAGTTILGDG